MCEPDEINLAVHKLTLTQGKLIRLETCKSGDAGIPFIVDKIEDFMDLFVVKSCDTEQTRALTTDAIYWLKRAQAIFQVKAVNSCKFKGYV